MTQPLALVCYERLLPGSQLVNRLQDLNYRVAAVADAGLLVAKALETKPLLVLVDLDVTHSEVCAGVVGLRANEATKHLPIIGFGTTTDKDRQTAALDAGVTLLVGPTALLEHLPQILEQALVVE